MGGDDADLASFFRSCRRCRRRWPRSFCRPRQETVTCGPVARALRARQPWDQAVIPLSKLRYELSAGRGARVHNERGRSTGVASCRRVVLLPWACPLPARRCPLRPCRRGPPAGRSGPQGAQYSLVVASPAGPGYDAPAREPEHRGRRENVCSLPRDPGKRHARPAEGERRCGLSPRPAGEVGVPRASPHARPRAAPPATDQGARACRPRTREV